MTDLPAGVTQEMVEAAATQISLWDGCEWDSFLGSRECSRNRYRDMARAALTAALAGRVVVPREASELMANAAELAYPATFQGMWTAAIEVSAITPGEAI